MTVKNVQLTGDVALTYGGAPGKKRQSRRKQAGGSSPGTVTQLRDDPGVPVIAEPVASVAPASPITGGALVKREQTPGPVKVVLDAPKKKPVVLQPKVVATERKTRKASRSIRVSVSGLGKRLHRAKTIRKDAGSLDLVEIKKALQKAALVKADTKAPESILRQMYADYMMLKDRAL